MEQPSSGMSNRSGGRPIGEYAIIESTLREGEQFVNAFFSPDEKVEIAQMLDEFGVEYMELTSPCASPASFEDCQRIAKLGLKAKTLTHIRCCREDAEKAVDTGVDGIDVVIGTSSYLRDFGHGKSIEQILELAQDVVGWLKTQDVEVRFSTEDSLRSNVDDILKIYSAVDLLHVDRVGIADTVGVGTPDQIYELVKNVVGGVQAGVEFHGHNDSGCAIANAYAALQGGAQFIDTTVLGIGERNGITPLGGLIARLYATDPQLVAKYDLTKLADIDHRVAAIVGIDVPFNNYITGFSAFTHKAGIHAKAVLNNPSTYEILDPQDFGLSRYIHVAHRLTGWNAIASRSAQLQLELDDDEIKAITAEVKAMSDSKSMTLDEVDRMLYAKSTAKELQQTGNQVEAVQ